MDEQTDRLDTATLLARLHDELLAGRSRIEFEHQFLPLDEALTARVVPEIRTEPRPGFAPLSWQTTNEVYFDEVDTFSLRVSRNSWQRYAKLLDATTPTLISTDPSWSVVEPVVEEEEEEETSEFIRLCRELVEKPPRGWVGCQIEDGFLVAVTDTVTLDDDHAWDMGQYTISFDDRFEPEIDEHSEQLQHPHYNGEWCWGNLHHLFHIARDEQDPGAVLAVVRELLGHYNPGDCYHTMADQDDDYPRRDENDARCCEDCGNVIGEDDSHYQIGGDTLCFECAGSCEHCGVDHRLDDLPSCEGKVGAFPCNRQECDDCGATCDRCGGFLCHLHAAQCEACDQTYCPTHQNDHQCKGAA